MRSTSAPELAEDDLAHVRTAVAAYFRTAARLAQASLVLRLAANCAGDDSDDARDRLEWLVERADTYQEKAEHMSDCGAALLGHAAVWSRRLRHDCEPDVDSLMEEFGGDVQQAADGYREVEVALAQSRLGDHPAYDELLEELRLCSSFLDAEAASFMGPAAARFRRLSVVDGGGKNPSRTP